MSPTFSYNRAGTNVLADFGVSVSRLTVLLVVGELLLILNITFQDVESCSHSACWNLSTRCVSAQSWQLCSFYTSFARVLVTLLFRWGLVQEKSWKLIFGTFSVPVHSSIQTTLHGVSSSFGLVTLSSNLFLSVPITLMAFQSHVMILPIYSELKGMFIGFFWFQSSCWRDQGGEGQKQASWYAEGHHSVFHSLCFLGMLLIIYESFFVHFAAMKSSFFLTQIVSSCWHGWIHALGWPHW